MSPADKGKFPTKEMIIENLQCCLCKKCHNTCLSCIHIGHDKQEKTSASRWWSDARAWSGMRVMV